jgi:hypothetical protein
MQLESHLILALGKEHPSCPGTLGVQEIPLGKVKACVSQQVRKQFWLRASLALL